MKSFFPGIGNASSWLLIASMFLLAPFDHGSASIFEDNDEDGFFAAIPDDAIADLRSRINRLKRAAKRARKIPNAKRKKRKIKRIRKSLRTSKQTLDRAIGVNEKPDCDDGNANINPDATEVCDGMDNDCNGLVDDGVGFVWYADRDGDGYGDGASTMVACAQPEGFVATDGDCDDDNASINPDATEIFDGIDNNCNGMIDEGFQD